jgi:hypothetical protein
LLELALEPDVAHDAHLQREPDPGGGARRCGARCRTRALGEPDDAPVLAEVVVAQFWVPVESQFPDDRALEGPGQEVGEEVRTGLFG